MSKKFRAYIYAISDDHRINHAVLDKALEIGYKPLVSWRNDAAKRLAFKDSKTMTLTGDGWIHFSTDPDPEYHFGQPLTMDFFNEKPPAEMVTVEMPADDLKWLVKRTFTNLDISNWQMPNEYHEQNSDLLGFKSPSGSKL
jgi:hypothetical protein